MELIVCVCVCVCFFWGWQIVVIPIFLAQKLLLPQAENKWALGLENLLFNFRNSQFYLCLGIPEKRWVPVSPIMPDKWQTDSMHAT